MMMSIATASDFIIAADPNPSMKSSNIEADRLSKTHDCEPVKNC